MMRRIKSMTLGDLLSSQSNDYGFDADRVSLVSSKKIPSLSVVIPYFENRIIGHTLFHLFRSIEKTKKIYPSWKYEVIIVDDGSQKFPFKKAYIPLGRKITLLRHNKNKGRTATRNSGLRQARLDKVLFLDSDILVEEKILIRHLRVHNFAKKIKKKIITTCCFENKKKAPKMDKIKFSNISPNDFRLHCIYNKTWIGSQKDKQFIGKCFKPIAQTKKFRAWPKNGFLGPWVLPNMILGGFFIADTTDAKKVGGFNTQFPVYGFTETTLITKLIALKRTFAVPLITTTALHIGKIGKGKNAYFKKAHKTYFGNFLRLTSNRTVATVN